MIRLALGSGPWTTFRRITWPMLWRGLLPAVIADLDMLEEWLARKERT